MQCALFDKLYLQTLEGWENERAQKELMQAMVKLYTVVLMFLSHAIQRLRMNTHETTDLNTDTYFLKMAEEKFDVDEIAGRIESAQSARPSPLHSYSSEKVYHSVEEVRRLKDILHSLEGLTHWSAIATSSPPAGQNLESDVNNILGRKPGLGDMHDQMLKTPASGPIVGRSAKKALNWMLCAQRPLKSRELIAAISVDSDGHHTSLTRNHITSICNGIVVWDSVLDEFRFTHLSVREYLELRDDYSFTKIHTLALERCLDVYLFESVTSTDSTIEQANGNYRSIAERNEIFRNYADIYWPLHCRIVQDNLDEANLPTKLQQFLFQESTLNNGLSFSKWISAMDSSEAKISRCPPILRRQLGAMFSTSTTPFFLASAFGLTSILDYLDRNRPRAWD